jgi:hypothetical protein
MGLGLVLVLVGVAFLLRDVGVWTFWGIEWWTVGFLLAGLGMWGCSCCKDCQSCCGVCDTGDMSSMKSMKKKK